MHKDPIRQLRLAAPICGTVMLGLMVISSLTLLPYSFRWNNVQALDVAVRHAPSAKPVVPFDRFTHVAGPDDRDSTASRFASAAHLTSSWLGHDDLGRSVSYRLSLGFLISLVIGVGSAFIAVAIGVTWGSVAAYCGGRLDGLMMRIVDVLYGLPYILLVILMKIALQRPLTSLLGENSRSANVIILFLAIGGVSWLTMARVVRGQALSLRARPFVEAARALGAGPMRILFRHILPNLIGPIVVYAALSVPQAILQEAFLSFLGIGIQQPLPSLGRMAAEGVHAVNAFVSYWWLLAYPCGVLVLTLLALNFIGDGLRDALDPQSTSAQRPW